VVVAVGAALEASPADDPAAGTDSTASAASGSVVGGAVAPVVVVGDVVAVVELLGIVAVVGLSFGGAGGASTSDAVVASASRAGASGAGGSAAAGGTRGTKAVRTTRICTARVAARPDGWGRTGARVLLVLIAPSACPPRASRQEREGKPTPLAARPPGMPVAR
jgi:hypothetical protein